jgi:hypothetical protein
VTGLAASFKSGLELLLTPLEALPAPAALVVCGVLLGALMLLVIKYSTPQARLRVARDRMSSAVYELRIYIDSPRRIFAAQLRLCCWSGVYLLYLLPPFIVLLPLLAVLHPALEARFGRAPLPVGQPFLLRLDLAPSASTLQRREAEQARIIGTPEVALTAPPVLVAGASLYLRLEVASEAEHLITVLAPGWSAQKRLSSAPHAKVMPVERRAGPAVALAIGDEPPLPTTGPVAAMTVDQPPSSRRWLGLPGPWWLAGLAVATATALLLRRRFGVVL